MRAELRGLAVGLAALLLLGACGAISGKSRVEIGAVTFAENQIVAEMYALVLEKAGYEVERHFNYQNREALQPELEDDAIDLAPEYLSSLLTSLDPDATPSSDPAENVQALEPLLDDRGLEVLTPSNANNTNALVVDARTAARFGLTLVSDLRPVAPRLVLGGPPECPERRFCLRGLETVYGLEFKDFKPLDAGGPLTIAALSSGEIDVALMFSTSGAISDRGWVELQDDKGLQTADNIVPLLRRDTLDDEAIRRLNAVSAALSTEEMKRLNARVEVDNEDFRVVAREFLQGHGLI
jgi:osmoprotectant transport system substrate-binding protein